MFKKLVSIILAVAMLASLAAVALVNVSAFFDNTFLGTGYYLNEYYFYMPDSWKGVNNPFFDNAVGKTDPYTGKTYTKEELEDMADTAYVWYNDDPGWSHINNREWPGAPCTATSHPNIFYVTVPTTVGRIMFNNGVMGTDKTDSLLFNVATQTGDVGTQLYMPEGSNPAFVNPDYPEGLESEVYDDEGNSLGYNTFDGMICVPQDFEDDALDMFEYMYPDFPHPKYLTKWYYFYGVEKDANGRVINPTEIGNASWGTTPEPEGYVKTGDVVTFEYKITVPENFAIENLDTRFYYNPAVVKPASKTGITESNYPAADNSKAPIEWDMPEDEPGVVYMNATRDYNPDARHGGINATYKEIIDDWGDKITVLDEYCVPEMVVIKIDMLAIADGDPGLGFAVYDMAAVEVDEDGETVKDAEGNSIEHLIFDSGKFNQAYKDVVYYPSDTISLSPPKTPVLTLGSYIIGDVNQDGKVGIRDATLIQKYLALMISSGEINKLAADVDGDGSINITDVITMQKYLAKIYTGNIGTVVGSVVEEAPEEDFEYTISNGTATITGYTGSASVLNIPSTLGGYAVTEIGYRTFYYCESLSNVTIPNSVTTIVEYAFEGCYNLTSITIPNSVTTIGNGAFLHCRSLTNIAIPNSVTIINDNAFASCRSLTSVTIPYSVTTIGKSAFDSCYNLTSITIPDSVTSIGEWAFYRCKNLTAIYVDSENEYYCSKDGVLFNKDKTTIVKYPMGKTQTTYTIPDSVTTIGNQAFIDCTSLTSITIPDSVNTIGGSAFNGCTSLTSVKIPNSVTTIGSSAFGNCDSLTSVTIPNSVTTISIMTFASCDSLTSVTLANSVTNIEAWAFENCYNLTSITIPRRGTGIGHEALANCNNLTIYCYPDSYAQTYAINNELPYVLLEPEITDYEYEVNFDGVSATITGYTGTGGDVVIPATLDGYAVTRIGDYAFYYCSSLTSITIPVGVTNIGTWAFGNCASLTSITIPTGVTTIGGSAFASCSSLTSIAIPYSVTSIGANSFDSTSLTNINVDKNNSAYSDIDGVLFNKRQTEIIRYPKGKTDLEYIIPNSVTSIGDYAFSDCTALTSVTIPNSVTKIGFCAFYYCDSLTSVTIGNSVTSIGEAAFASCYGLTISCYEDSNAHSYVINNGIPYVLLETDTIYFRINNEAIMDEFGIILYDVSVYLFNNALGYDSETWPGTRMNYSHTEGNYTYYTLEKELGYLSQFDHIIFNAFDYNYYGYYQTPDIPINGNTAWSLNTSWLDVTPYTLPTPDPEPTVTPGDPTGDGEINIFDIMAIRDYIFGNSTLTGDAFTAADVNQDGETNVFDIMAIRNHIFGITLLA
ncbi:MAG: leucine-rich repeat protein [Oscillospiraceae bacterium]|jgi:hypothetical protein|nr:leucine-rich repeat protein [Oscillospiraceae bacterium]